MMTSHVQKPIGGPATDATTTRCARRVGRLALVFVLAALGVFEPAAPAAADGDPPVDLAAVDRLVSDGLEESSIPGAAIAITQGTQVLHVRGYGQDANDVRSPRTAASASHH